MDLFRSMSVDPTGFGASDVCPFLGLKDDAESHYHGETSEHFCHRVDPALPVRLRQQSSYCLVEAYEECPVFLYYHRGLTPKETRMAFASGWGAAFENGLSGLLSNRRSLMIILAAILVPIIFIVIGVGVAAILDRLNPDRVEQVVVVSPTLEGVLDRIEPTSTIVPTSTPGDSIALAAFPSPTPEPSLTPTDEPTLTSTPTQTAIPFAVDCGTPASYNYVILDGPVLLPEIGFEYGSGDTPPVVQATWYVQNTSGCSWTNLALYSRASLRTFAPLVFVDGVQIELNPRSSTASVSPGDIVELALSFSPEVSRYVTSEFALVINGFRLLDQPNLVIDVRNWVIRIAASPTVKVPGTGPGVSKSTTEPDLREVATPPAERP